MVIYNSPIKKPKQPYQKMGRRTKQTFCQRKQTDCKQAHEKKLNIATREMQVKTTLRYHFTQARRAIIKKSLQNNTGQKGHH